MRMIAWGWKRVVLVSKLRPCGLVMALARARWRERLFYHSRGYNCRYLLRWVIFCTVILSSYTESVTAANSRTPARIEAGSLPDTRIDSLPITIPVVDGQDIRFRRLSGSAGLSQTRVAWVVQDNLGFIWFGTQYGLNRYDGYRSKVFKHEAGRSNSLSCVYVRSLFVDHSGTLWSAAIDFSISMNRSPKPLLTIASTQRLPAIFPPQSSGLMRMTPEYYGWQRPGDSTGWIPLRVKPPDIPMIHRIPRASVETSYPLQGKIGLGDFG